MWTLSPTCGQSVDGVGEGTGRGQQTALVPLVQHPRATGRHWGRYRVTLLRHGADAHLGTTEAQQTHKREHI